MRLNPPWKFQRTVNWEIETQDKTSSFTQETCYKKLIFTIFEFLLANSEKKLPLAKTAS